MDLIDRASLLKAIDEYERLSAVSQTVRNMTSLREIVQWLPSVQLEPKPDKNGSEPFGNAEMLSDRTTDDCISRQAAIDALSTPHGILYPIRTVEALPSAQPTVHPQRTCVNCGRTVNNGGWYADGRTRCPIEEHYALPKDGYCHLWEKRNVTDDDYPERREE